MKKYKIIILAAAMMSLFVIAQGCSSSSLVDVWHDASYKEAPLKKVLIIAMRNEPTQRRIWEDAFVGELAKTGTNALPSYHLFPDGLPDTDQVIRTVQDNGFDGILVTWPLFSQTKTNYIPGYVTTDQDLRYSNFRKRYDIYYHNVRHPGYVEMETIDRRAIDVWVIRNEDRMIWSATSMTPELNTTEAVQEDIANLVIPELAKNGIIKLVRLTEK